MRQIAILFAAAVALLCRAAPLQADPAPPAAEAKAAIQACVAQAPTELQPHWERICAGEPRNRVLDYMHGGMAALMTGHADLAERAFDISLDGIEAVYAESEAAAKARSVWHAESTKDFKGEPHERAMAYYYRGLLYLARGDWDNAQAAFQGGTLQDTFADQERYRADMGSLVWLEAWANRCRGNTDRAKELFAEAQDINPKLAPPKPEQTVLVIAETGLGPLKFAAGAGGQSLGVREGFIGNYAVAAQQGGTRVPMVAAEDTFYQAVTRGGRPADKIMAEKLELKEGTAAFGRAAMVAGIGTMAFSRASHDNNRQNNNAAALGAAVALVGLLAYAAAKSMETEVDTRTWTTLPHSVHLLASEPPPGGNLDSFDLVDPGGRSILVSREALLYTPPKPCGLVWAGAHNVAPSLAVEAGPGEGAGNCRTSTGALAMMDPMICSRIGGTPLGR